MEKLNLPIELEMLSQQINGTSLDLGEVTIDSHPMISIPHTRVLKIIKLIANLEATRTDIYFVQVLTNLNGVIIPANLPKPDWTIHANETSSLRNENKERIILEVLTDEEEENVFLPKIDEEGNPVLAPLLFNSHKYLCWVLKNDRVGLIELLQGYMMEKLYLEPEFLARLNSL